MRRQANHASRASHSSKGHESIHEETLKTFRVDPCNAQRATSQCMEADLTEECADEPAKWQVTLRNGAVVDARESEAELAELDLQNRRSPKAIELLLAAAKGEKTPGDLTDELKLLFGAVWDTAKNVVLCSVRNTPEGIVLVDPYQQTQENRRVLAEVKSVSDANSWRLLHGKRLIQDDQPGPSL